MATLTRQENRSRSRYRSVHPCSDLVRQRIGDNYAEIDGDLRCVCKRCGFLYSAWELKREGEGIRPYYWHWTRKQGERCYAAVTGLVVAHSGGWLEVEWAYAGGSVHIELMTHDQWLDLVREGDRLHKCPPP